MQPNGPAPAICGKEPEALLEAIADSAVELLRFHDIERSLPRILQTLGAATGADRMQFMQCEETAAGEIKIKRHFSWSASGVRPSILVDWVEGRTMDENGFRPWGDRLSRGEIIAGTADSFEPAIRELLEEDSVRSVVVVPVSVDGCWWGLIGFDDCHAVREWSSVEIDALRTLAEMIGTAVSRARDVAHLADARRIVENSPTLLFRLDAGPPFPLQYVSPNVARYGYSASELLAEPTRWLDLVHPADLPGVTSSIQSIVDGRSCETEAEFRLTKPDGEHVWFDGHSTAYKDSEDRLIAIEGLITDVTERKQAAKKIEHLAKTDTLTGLANRREFLDRLGEVCKQAKHRNEPFAVHFIDLDRFKEINDTLGHPAGDELLHAVARRLIRCVRKDDVVARFGGDEFAVLQLNLPSARFAEKMAKKICKVVGQPYKISGHTLEVTVSVGLDCHSGEEILPEDMMSRADLALYKAKEEGRNCVRVYRPGLEADGTALASNLRTASAA